MEKILHKVNLIGGMSQRVSETNGVGGSLTTDIIL